MFPRIDSLVSCALAALLLVPALARGDEAPAELERLLREETQALLDAVGTGDKAVWDRLLDPRALYVTEAGDIYTKEQLLAELAPLPPGLDGELRIASFRLVVHGDTAVATHEDAERLDYHGQRVNTRFLTTNTWRRTSDGWKVIATQVLAILEDPPAVTLPARLLDEYAGVYRLTPEITYTIRRDGEKLYGLRSGRQEQELRAEVADVLFVPGQPRSRKIVLRDEAGRITGIADRREGHDIVWTRVDKGEWRRM